MRATKCKRETLHRTLKCLLLLLAPLDIIWATKVTEVAEWSIVAASSAESMCAWPADAQMVASGTYGWPFLRPKGGKVRHCRIQVQHATWVAVCGLTIMPLAWLCQDAGGNLTILWHGVSGAAAGGNLSIRCVHLRRCGTRLTLQVRARAASQRMLLSSAVQQLQPRR